MKVLCADVPAIIRPSASKTWLNAAERLVLEEGRAAVTGHRINEILWLPSPLVHFYFRSIDDLLAAVVRRRADRSLKELAEALGSPQPLWGAWRLANDPAFGLFTTELLALATRRVRLRAALAYHAERLRTAQIEGLAEVLQSHPTGRMPPEAAALLMAAVPQILLAEQALGIAAGHGETVAVVESYLRELEGDPPAR